MKVKKVLALAAGNLGREDLAARVGECVGTPEGELASLLRCYNLVENEIALDYFPLKAIETVAVAGGAVSFAKLLYAPVEILEARENGRKLPFSVLRDRLVFREAVSGPVEIEYLYSPDVKEWTDDCELGGAVSERLLSYGVCAEFCLTEAKFAEAAVWDKKYRDCLRAANANRRKLCVRPRRWE